MVAQISGGNNVIGAFLTKTDGRISYDSALENADSGYLSVNQDCYIGSNSSKEKLRDYLSKQINSFEDFVNNYKSLYPHNADLQDTDYAKEFENFLKEKGCKNINELQALNETGFDTVEELKKNSKIMIAKTLLEMASKGQYSGDINEDLNYIVNNSSVESLSQYYTQAKKGDNEAAKALENLIKQLPADSDEEQKKKEKLLKFFEGDFNIRNSESKVFNGVQNYNSIQISKYLN